MSCYLWSLFEGRRTAEEYVAAAERFAQQCPAGVFQLALHPWHLFCDGNGAAFSSADARRNCTALAEVLRRSAGVPRVVVKPLAQCLPALPAR